MREDHWSWVLGTLLLYVLEIAKIKREIKEKEKKISETIAKYAFNYLEFKWWRGGLKQMFSSVPRAGVQNSLVQ